MQNHKQFIQQSLESHILKAVDITRSASLSELRDIDFVAQIFRTAGEVNGVTGTSFQKAEEIAEAVVFLSTQRIETYMELGVYRGGTFAVITAYLQRFSPNPDKFFARAIDGQRMIDWSLLEEILPIQFEERATTTTPNPQCDLCFIDATHTYDAVKADYTIVGKHARICMFHDIFDHLCEVQQGGGVPGFWREVVATYPCKVKMISCEPHNDYGIGILFQCSFMENHYPVYSRKSLL